MVNVQLFVQMPLFLVQTARERFKESFYPLIRLLRFARKDPFNQIPLHLSLRRSLRLKQSLLFMGLLRFARNDKSSLRLLRFARKDPFNQIPLHLSLRRSPRLKQSLLFMGLLRFARNDKSSLRLLRFR
jgi:hypothetical protein